MADAAAKSVKRVGKYEIGKTLGEGTFGKVKYAVNTETGEKVSGRGWPSAARHSPRVEAGPPPLLSATRPATLPHPPTRPADLSLSSAGGHQNPGQGEDPKAEHGRADQERGAWWLCLRRECLAGQRRWAAPRTRALQ